MLVSHVETETQEFKRYITSVTYKNLRKQLLLKVVYTMKGRSCSPGNVLAFYNGQSLQNMILSCK